MAKKQPRVFVLGAGASKSCGLPLTNELLINVLPTFTYNENRKALDEFIEYLYPDFNPKWKNYPNLEELLSLIDIYIEFSPTVKKKHRFSMTRAKDIRRRLLRAISMYLCDYEPRRFRRTKLYRLVEKLRRGDVVISFNWDQLVERALWEQHRIRTLSYTLDRTKITLLKPHGSSDWFDSREVILGPDRSFPLIPAGGRICVHREFEYPAGQKKPIVPVIVPPVQKKEFKHDEFKILWKDCWKALRDTKELHIIGVSLPPEDLHVRFILRGAIRSNKWESEGRLKVTLVNPDRTALLRLGRLVQSRIRYFECGFQDADLNELLGS